MKKIFLIYVVPIFLFFSFAVYNIMRNAKRSNEIYSKYTFLTKESIIEGRVIDKFDYYANGHRYSGYESLLVIGKKRFEINAQMIGDSTQGIYDYISVGDSIFKKSMNDTIILKKYNGKILKFLRLNDF